jgi:hypothetical protein
VSTSGRAIFIESLPGGRKTATRTVLEQRFDPCP